MYVFKTLRQWSDLIYNPLTGAMGLKKEEYRQALPGEDDDYNNVDISDLLKNNNEHAITTHNISMWRTRSQALSIVPKNTKLILSRPDLQWLEEMKIPDSGLDVIGQSGIFDDNYFAGSLEDISLLKNIYFQYYNICNKYNISADTHTVLEHYLTNECNNLNLLNPNYSRFLILNSAGGKYRTN